MANPHTDSPVMPAIAEQILLNPQEFHDTARKHTEAYAQSKTT
jgi:ubiquitin-protein ligase